MDQIFPRRTYIIRNKKSEHHHWIQHIRISLGTKFQLQLAILTFWIKFIQKICSGWKKKIWTYCVILHIWIILRTKFQLKLTILSFWTKFTQKGYFQSKTEQAVQGLPAFAFCAVKVISTIVLEHLEDLKNPIILNILKEKLVMSWLLDSFILKLYKTFQTALWSK